MNKIVFRVIANRKVGLGHVYRALAIANSLKFQKIIFITDNTDAPNVKKIVRNKYRIIKCQKSKIVKEIIKLKPNLVINDILSTYYKDTLDIKKQNIKIINFEDIGVGSKYADATINEIYDKPLNTYTNTYWGSKYFFLRDEFKKVKPVKFKRKIKNIIITFGGSDQFNLTFKTYEAVKEICKKNLIKIHIVTGPAYRYANTLSKKTIDDHNLEIHNSTGIISKIMTKCDLAICSNGRTVFELAHMNIPSLVIPQHQREQTHSFSSIMTGFIVLRMYQKNYNFNSLSKYFVKLINNVAFRKKLYSRMVKYNFIDNKKKTINIINKYLL
tara:strand:+ start:12330 stop:13313 length:984 start_codon:yes stop_codon:yes gene_type:complete